MRKERKMRHWEKESINGNPVEVTTATIWFTPPWGVEKRELVRLTVGEARGKIFWSAKVKPEELPPNYTISKYGFSQSITEAKSEAESSLKEIAVEIMKLKNQYLRGEFTEDGITIA